MESFEPFTSTHILDYEGLIRNLRREGTPSRVFFIELFQDRPIEDAIDRKFGVTSRLDPSKPDYELERSIEMQSSNRSK